jgi:Helix-turn-helix domain
LRAKPLSGDNGEGRHTVAKTLERHGKHRAVILSADGNGCKRNRPTLQHYFMPSKTKTTKSNGARPAAITPGALRTKDACQYLSVSTPTIHRLAARGLLKPQRALRTLLWPIKELDRFIAS